jgi:hypothetical protein
MTPGIAGLAEGDAEELGEGEGVMDMVKEPVTVEVGVGVGSGKLLAEPEGDCEASVGTGTTSSLEAFCPPGDNALTPKAIAIAANVPPPTTVRLVVLMEFETVPLPASCLRLSRRSRFASLRACCDMEHPASTYRSDWEIFPQEISVRHLR